MSESQNANTKQNQQLGVRISWETKVSDSGIQIAGGPSTITKYGTIIGSNLVQTQQGTGILLIVVGDDKTFNIIEAGLAKIL